MDECMRRLGFNSPVGTGGVLDLCLCCGGVGGDWVGDWVGAWTRVWRGGVMSGFSV